ncbi:hypothetical protein CU098_010789 [Rhizopus stolonifer]|uniref:BHLH domain-containing protein n=1 Tax=Rhizopus stolonifer TaxID=4846 RepID=A0A367K7T5_RHIST|nr:hypothetical protein CU098_010789 [Rhizopus stolonifer]
MNNKNTSRLSHPTAYHMQQMRYNKEGSTIGIDPSQMLENTQLLFPQKQQDSPSLSDLDYSELTNSPIGEYRSRQSSYQQGDMFDETKSFGVQMKRSSTEIETAAMGGMTGGYAHHYYPSFDNPMKQMAGSAPSHMGFHDYPRMEDMPSSVVNPSHHDLLEEHYPSEDYSAQANMQAIMEKRRRRRESHNAVERRRRDNINERIQELGTLLPDSLDDGVNRMNKGTILRKSVEQIRKLQNDVVQHQQRVRDLEHVLQQIQQQQSIRRLNHMP